MPARQKGKTLRSTKWLRDERIAFPLTPEEHRGSWQIRGEGSLEEGYRTLEHWSGQGSDGQDCRRAKGQELWIGCCGEEGLNLSGQSGGGNGKTKQLTIPWCMKG